MFFNLHACISSKMPEALYYNLQAFTFFIHFIEVDSLRDVKPGMWVVVRYCKKWYPGEVVSIVEDDIEVKCMKEIGQNKLIWPEKDDVCWYMRTELVCTVSPPYLVTTRGTFGFSKEDLENVLVKF